MCSPVIEDSSWLEKRITEHVAQASLATQYRPPLLAFARASDPRFLELQRRVPGHLSPYDLLPEAQTVCAFFVPFAPLIVHANVHGRAASEVWARAYVETNALLAELCDLLVDELSAAGVRAAYEPPTYHFDPVRLISAWSHKSVACVAGLGKFGHHHMLITEAGCAGRLGSLVLDAPISPTPPPKGDYCTFERGCRACIRRCPSGALTAEGLDRQRCYAQCLKNDELFPQWLADVCGKCVTVPCAFGAARSC